MEPTFDTCLHLQCDRQPRARGLCNAHYMALKRGGLPPLERRKPTKPLGIKELAQKGLNTSCVDCGAEPYGGGMRCLPCFGKRCDERAKSLSRAHLFPDRKVGSGAYKDGCRCEGCRESNAVYQRKWKARQ
jgi:hypothetical protein